MASLWAIPSNEEINFRRLSAARISHEIFGYDPHIRLIDSPLAHEKHSHPTIYLHGFGDNGEHFLSYMQSVTRCIQIEQLLTYEPYLLTYPAIFFDFADAGLKTAKSIWQKWSALRHTNLGQLQDILSFAYVLALCRNAGYKAIDLYGFSRGATTIINTLYVLLHNCYRQELLSIGIDEQACADIISMVHKGCITLDCPLKHLKEKFGTILGPLVNYCLFPLLADYSPWGLHAIDCCQILSQYQFSVLIHYERKDAVVTNWGDRLMYEKLRSENKDKTFIVKSDDGGHVTIRKQLPLVFHAFIRKYGYTNHPMSREQADSILATYQPAPEKIEDI
jgi:hypothetical protein